MQQSEKQSREQKIYQGMEERRNAALLGFKTTERWCLKGQTPSLTSKEGMFGQVSRGWRITGHEGQLEKRKHSFGTSLSDQTDSPVVSASSTFANMEQLFRHVNSNLLPAIGKETACRFSAPTAGAVAEPHIVLLNVNDLVSGMRVLPPFLLGGNFH